MILVCKNVYKDVFLFENVSMFVKCLERRVFVLKIARIVCLEIEQVTRSNLPTQMSFLCIFYSFDIVALPLIW